VHQIAERNPPRPTGPELLALSAGHAGAGHKVAISGRRLRNARRVLFIGQDTGAVSARFVVWNDTRLLASVPDMGERTQAAVIAVHTEDGVAVMVPAGTPIPATDSAATPVGPMAVVPYGGTSFGGAARVMFVEDGGAAAAGPLAAVFVRRGGRVTDVGRGALVFCENGVVPTGDATPSIVIVPVVNPCFVESLFHYTGKIGSEVGPQYSTAKSRANALCDD
jgi:hypothetical protein